jgi:hypothetical protein
MADVSRMLTFIALRRATTDRISPLHAVVQLSPVRCFVIRPQGDGFRTWGTPKGNLVWELGRAMSR